MLEWGKAIFYSLLTDLLTETFIPQVQAAFLRIY